MKKGQVMLILFAFFGALAFGLMGCADNDEESKYCTITFNANGGVGRMDNIRTLAGKGVILPFVTFTKEGFIFKEWQAWEKDAEEESDTFDDGAILRTQVDLTLKAVWIEE